MPETMMSDFVRSRRELKYSLTDVMDWSKDLEEKYQSMALLVETLSQANFKKDKKIQQLKKKVQKYKSQAKAKKLRTNPLPTTTPDGKHVILYQELLDLTEEPDFEEEEEQEDEEEAQDEEEQEVEIIEKENINIKIKKESNTLIAPPSTPNNEVVELEEEEEENILEKEVVEDDIEPALEPDSEEEPEPEMQPTEEPVLEKEVEVEEEEVEEEEVVEKKDGHTEEEEEELYETTINGKAYYVVNETNGPIYAIAEDEEVGDEIGKFVNGKPVFQESSTAPDTETTEEEELDLYQVKINGTNYAVENETDGPIYELVFDGDVGEQVGQYVKGKPTFFKK